MRNVADDNSVYSDYSEAPRKPRVTMDQEGLAPAWVKGKTHSCALPYRVVKTSHHPWHPAEVMAYARGHQGKVALEKHLLAQSDIGRS